MTRDFQLSFTACYKSDGHVSGFKRSYGSLDAARLAAEFDGRMNWAEWTITHKPSGTVIERTRMPR